MNILTAAFFDRDPQVVAKDLLGKVIRVKRGSFWLSAQIIETEAYYLNERGSHSSLGFTEKRKALFMPAGTIYMYYARGGDSLNISCHGEGNAVLIKSAIPYLSAGFDHTTVANLESKIKKSESEMLAIMQQLNPQKNSTQPRRIEKLCSGQTLLCKSLGLKVSEWNQKSFDSQRFYFADVNYSPAEIVQVRRLGIPVGRDEHLPYRFVDVVYAKYCTRNPLTLRTSLLTR